MNLINTLSVEIQFHLFEFLPSRDLAQVRGTCKSYKSISNYILKQRSHQAIVKLSQEYTHLESSFEEIHTEKKPQLNHFRGFLRAIPATYLSEASWYTNPPKELMTVCECLVILKNGQDALKAFSAENSSTTASDLKWAEIKRQMSRYDFKTWFVNLRKTVDAIPIDNVKQVQHIIMYDPMITYERLRDVSMTGYHLLIIVAACLQYGTIAQDLKLKQREMSKLQRQMTVLVKFNKYLQ
jgi:hypothetical protein